VIAYMLHYLTVCGKAFTNPLIHRSPCMGFRTGSL
jgi:hypothetical protein